MRKISMTIFGEPASKANSRRLVRFGGKVASIKSAKALNYVKGFQIQCKRLDLLMTGDLAVKIKIFYASRRPDLDESVILDAMQGLIYNNDRQVKLKIVAWALDPASPRAEIQVRELSEPAGRAQTTSAADRQNTSRRKRKQKIQEL